jgi:hypothetical protein
MNFVPGKPLPEFKEYHKKLKGSRVSCLKFLDNIYEVFAKALEKLWTEFELFHLDLCDDRLTNTVSSHFLRINLYIRSYSLDKT